MTTKFKEGTGPFKRGLFIVYTGSVNGTAIGWGGAGFIALQTALDIDTVQVVKTGSKALATYLLPGSVLLAWVQNADKYYYYGKKALKHGSTAYKAAKTFTSPLVAVNYIGGKLLTRTGLTEVMKSFCNVDECDDFYWEKPEYCLNQDV